MIKDKMINLIERIIIYFVLFVVIPFIPGYIYARFHKILFYIGINLINGGKIDNSELGVFLGNLVGMFLYHIIFSFIMNKFSFFKRISKYFVDYCKKYCEISFDNITYSEYIDKIILIGFICCYLAIYINNNDIRLQIIAIYLSLYSIFNSKPQRNY